MTNPRPTVGEIVYRWHEAGRPEPTADQVSAAKLWLTVLAPTTGDSAAKKRSRQLCQELLAQAELAQDQDPPVPHDLGYRTNPMRVGAPLPEEMDAIRRPDPVMVGAELARAQVELMYAVARHRKAWSAMREYRRLQQERQGPRAYLDSDPIWRIRTGDVQWWRDEMLAQAATITALTTMVEMRS